MKIGIFLKTVNHKMDIISLYYHNIQKMLLNVDINVIHVKILLIIVLCNIIFNYIFYYIIFINIFILLNYINLKINIVVMTILIDKIHPTVIVQEEL